MTSRHIKLAISGAGGFLGSAATRFFAAHPTVAEVRTLYSPHSATSLAAARVRAFAGELHDPADCCAWLGEADVVLHLANRGFPSDRVDRPDELVTRNLAATGQLLQSMRQKGITRILYASSGGAIYKPRAEGAPFTEDSEIEFRSAYAVYKIATEHLVAHYRQAFGLRPVVLRISNPYGPGQLGRNRQGFLGVALQRIMKKEPLSIWGDLEIVKDFLYIEDLLKAFEAFILDGALPAGTYNVGSGRGHTLAETVGILERVTGKKLPLTFQERRKSDSPWTVLDTARIRAATGWQSTTSLEKGVEAMWEELHSKRKVAA